MSKIIILVIVVFLLLINCSYPELPLIYGSEEIPDLGIESPYDALAWTSKNIEYEADDGDEWQSPQHTYEIGHGDCEDFCLLAMYLIHRSSGIKTTMMLGQDSREYAAHHWIELDGEWWEPQSNRRCESYRDRYPTINDNRDMRAWTFLVHCM